MTVSFRLHPTWVARRMVSVIRLIFGPRRDETTRCRPTPTVRSEVSERATDTPIPRAFPGSAFPRPRIGNSSPCRLSAKATGATERSRSVKISMRTRPFAPRGWQPAARSIAPGSRTARVVRSPPHSTRSPEGWNESEVSPKVGKPKTVRPLMDQARYLMGMPISVTLPTS